MHENDAFTDRNKRFSYLVARENARRIVADPAVLDIATAHLERFSRHDPHQRDGYTLWVALLEQGPQAVMDRLVERSPRGDYARETAPSFGGLPAAKRAELLRRARKAPGASPGMKSRKVMRPGTRGSPKDGGLG